MKRLIAFISAIFILFSGTAVFAYEEDSRGTEELMSFLGTNLEVNGENKLTRADAARLYCISAGVGSKGKMESSLLDISGVTDNVTVVTAYNMGWITVSRENYFEPDKEISCFDFARGFVKILGYTYSAQQSGYGAIISRLGLLDGIEDGNGALDTKSAITILSNALTAPCTVQSVFGNGVYYALSKEGATLLKDVHNLDVIEGYVTAIDITGLYSNVGAGSGKIAISGEIYNTSLQRDDVLGRYVKAYLYDKNSLNEIKAIFVSPSGNKEEKVVLDENIAVYTVDDKIKIEADGKIKTKVVNTNASYIYNGSFDINYRLEDINNVKFGTITTLDYNSDNKIDVIFVEEYKNYLVSSSTADKIFDKYGQEPIDLSDTNIEYLSLKKNGKEISINEVETYDAASVYMSNDGRIVRIEISNDKLLEEIKGTSVKNGYTHFLIDGKWYVSAMFGASAPQLKNGDWGKICFDVYGRIAGIDLKSDKVTYGFMTAVAPANFAEDTQIKVMTSIGSYKIYNLASKVSLNGSAKVSADVIARGLVNANPQLISYEVNSNNEICSLKTVATGGIVENEKITNGRWMRNSYALNSRYIADTDTVIFNVPATWTDFEDDDISVVSPGSLNDAALYTMTIYDADELHIMGAAIMSGQSTTTKDYEMYFIKKVEKTLLDDSGTVSDVLHYSKNGSELSLFLDESLQGQVQEGTGICVEYDSSGNVARFTKEFDAAEFDATYADGYKIVLYKESGYWSASDCVTMVGEIEYISDGIFVLKDSEFVNKVGAQYSCFDYYDRNQYFSEIEFEELKPGDTVYVVKRKDVVKTIVRKN